MIRSLALATLAAVPAFAADYAIDDDHTFALFRVQHMGAGFTWGRFRDFSALLATIEYRWDIWMWADALLFVDYGGTFGFGYRDFQLDKLHPNVGIGIRLRTSRRVYLRFQVAYGWPDGVQFYVVSSAGP